MLTLTFILIALYYLESQNLVHRDISYTNILLRSPNSEEDSKLKSDKRREIVKELGLSEIDEIRRELNCREGLLIDFDYAAVIDVKKTSDQADACTVNETLGESQVESVEGIQDSNIGSSQGEDFEVVDDEDIGHSALQPITKNVSGVRTVSNFYYCVRPSDA